MNIQGTVYHHKTLRPLAGIPVSDGRHTAFTDEAGHFELPGWERGHLVQLGILTEGHDDWYLHTEDHQGTYDFYTAPVETPEDFNFLHLSDTEIEPIGCLPFLSFVRQTADAEGPAFLVHTGDICRAYGLRRHYKEMNRQAVGCPVRYVIGNHDYCDGPYGEYLYEQLYGPTWYSFDCGKIHFAALSFGHGEGKTPGYQPEDQWLWLEQDIKAMKPGQRLIILAHDHCKDELGFCPEIGGRTYKLPASGLLAWVFGHLHINYTHLDNGILNICTDSPGCAGCGSSPAAVRKIALRGHELSTQCFYRGYTPIEDPSPTLWQTKLPGRISYPRPLRVENDLILCTSDDGWPRDCGIYRISGETGEICWKSPLENSILGQAACDGERIFALDTHCLLHCLDAATGKELWNKLIPRPNYTFAHAAVFTLGERVFAGGEADIYCFTKDGALLWKHEGGAGVPCPTRPVLDAERNQLIYGSLWRRFFALDIETGALRWEIKGVGYLGFRTQTPLLHNGILYAAGLNRLYKVDAATGAVLMEKELGIAMDVTAAPLMDEGTLYAPSNEGGVLALDPETLEIRRKFPAGRALLYTAPYYYKPQEAVEGDLQIEGDTLTFASMDGNIYFYDKNTAALQKTIRLNGPSLSAPLLEKDTLIAADFTGTVAKYNR